MMLRMHPSNTQRLVMRIGSGVHAVQIYEGEIPVVDSNFAFVPTDYADRRLASTSIVISYSTEGSFLSGTSQAFVPTKTGTASWFALLGESNEYVIGTLTNNSASNDPMLLSAINLEKDVQASIIDYKVNFGL